MEITTVKDQAIKNYGRTWTKEMIALIVKKGKLTPEEYKEITGEKYTV